ncbi:hypothetical protein CAAN1_08S02388 [[Candida] anglica]|uniref:Bul1 C-terminal domain-containing protein n=1 Tax=[Candida] anglica TaxID=148631 RepID=A0ABP0EAA0_9ASCO
MTSSRDILRQEVSPHYSEPEVHPLVSPRHEDVPTWNILPSYQLYEATFSKTLSISKEDLKLDPPSYEQSSPNELLGTGDGYFAGVSIPSSNDQPARSTTISPTSSTSTPASSYPAESSRWENSILGNTHKLKRVGTQKQPHPLKINIQLIDGPGEIGKVPNLIEDPFEIEYQQGDSLFGYVTVRNDSSADVPFNMFSVVFEGKVSVMNTIGDTIDSKCPLIFYKFLNMFDYNASWTPAFIDTNVRESGIDPIDGTTLQFPMERVFAPKTTYKKFFTFTIPEKLLDCACEIHNLSQHCEALPTIGLAREQFLIELRRLREQQRPPVSAQSTRPQLKATSSSSSIGSKNGVHKVLKTRIKDFSFPDTAISYSIEARVVGKASDYPKIFKDSIQDEFVLVNESSCYVRLIPRERLSQDVSKDQILRESKLVYENIISRIDESLENDQTSGKTPMRKSSTRKLPHLYKPMEKLSISSPPIYSLTIPCIKKATLTSAAKSIGVISLSTPKRTYVLPYVTHETKATKKINSRITIPLDFTFQGTKSPPELKNISVELIAFTYRSKKYPVPIEFYHDLLFTNSSSTNQSFEHIVTNKFQRYLTTINKLSQVVGWENINVSKQLFMDIKSLAKLQPKYTSIRADHVEISPLKWCKTSGANSSEYSGETVVSINEKTFHTESDICLVPSFQSCIIGRLYYLKITISMQHAEPIVMKIPINIEKS